MPSRSVSLVRNAIVISPPRLFPAGSIARNLQGRLPARLFCLFLQAKNRPEVLLRRGVGGRLRHGPIAAVEGALLVAPGGALGLVDLPVVIGVDAVEAFAEAAVAVGFGQVGEPIVIGFDLFEPGFLPRREIGSRHSWAASSLRRRSLKLSRQSRYCSKVIGSSSCGGWAAGGAAGCAASPGSHSVAAIAAEAARRVHFIRFLPGCPVYSSRMRTNREYKLLRDEGDYILD